MRVCVVMMRIADIYIKSTSLIPYVVVWFTGTGGT